MTTEPLCLEPSWERYPISAADPDARRWIRSCAMLGLAPNTISAYVRAIEGFLDFCRRRCIQARSASREAIAQYVGDLRAQRPRVHANVVRIDSGAVLANATLQQRLTAVRLFFEFLVDEGLMRANPVGRGRYTLSRGFGGRGERPRFRSSKLPWILRRTVGLDPGCGFQGADPQSLHAGVRLRCGASARRAMPTS
jgi:hypothetical protein